ncbi:MAG: zinc ribbon domain-containing protein [Faecousia sp.]
MTIWDNITKKASVLTEKAVQQARDLSEVAKLHGQIAEAERIANDSYHQLGRLYAAAHPEDYEEGFGDLIAAAAKAEKRIKSLRKQIQDVKGVTVCAKCGAEVSKDDAFCSVCGAEIPKTTPVEAEIVTEGVPVEEPAEDAASWEACEETAE